MKKYLLRTIVFALTFAVGVGLIRSLKLLNFGSDKQPKIVFCSLPDKTENAVETSPNGKVEVLFKEFVTEKDGLAMKFEIVNKNTKSAYYSANAYGEIKETGDLIPYVKVDGKEEKKFICGTGLEIFQLKSGQSIEYTVANWSFANYLQKGNNYQIGFTFDFGEKNLYRTYWSENLPITPEIRRQMINDLKKIEKSGR